MSVDKKKLRIWQERLGKNQTAFENELAKMDNREKLYAGDKETLPVTRGDTKRNTPHVRNIIAELIEAQVDSNIPQPKVIPRYKKDEKKAKIIEDMLRNELEKQRIEEVNDIMERTVPMQGGAFYWLEWDNTQRTHTTVGELQVSALHPKKVIPQDGVYSSIEDMDYIILRVPQTKEYIYNRYGVDVSDEGENEPEIKGIGDDAADDLVTQYIAYYRNDNGGIGLYSWVNDIHLEDIEDYQARRLKRCKKCGQVQHGDVQAITTPTLDGTNPLTVGHEGAQVVKPNKATCQYCGSTAFEDSTEDYEEIYAPILRSDGSVIPGATMQLVDTGEVDEMGMPIQMPEQVPLKVPYYKPDIYPVIMQRNVSVFGKLLGDSDVDKITTHQNTINRIEMKIIEKLVTSGSYITLPDEASIKVDTAEAKVIRPGNAASKAMIDVYDLEGNISQDLNYLAQVYEEARQAIGITDSFQGRKDATATSGKAKEFSAAQSAGRLESKRVLKNAAYSALFEAMFKFKLAYADEPRPVVAKDMRGNNQFEEFNRYDFLEQDAAGEWFWNDQFLFACDTSAPLASNREAMWQETQAYFSAGAFGDPTQYPTMILFWNKMEMLHYPGAAETKQYLEEEYQKQMQMQQMQMQQQMQIAQIQQQMQAQQIRADAAAAAIQSAQKTK